jgi:hypothetical protein
MLKKFLILTTFLLIPLVSVADELQLNENAPTTYIVEKGDTLWDISSVFLDQPWLWPKLWRLNPEINNPHLIYPGDVLTLVYDEQGEPMLVIEEPFIESVTEPEPEVIIEPEPEVVVVKEKPSLKWSPKVREEVKKAPINTLPLEVIAPYLRYDSMFSQEQIDAAPYVIGSDEGYKSSIDGFKVYVKGDLKIAQTYAIYQKKSEIFDPETEESLGFSVKLVGTAQALRTGDMENKVPATLHVNSATREIRAGSFVVPINEGQLYPAYFTMQAADASIRGAIIHSANDNREFGKFEVVLINRGEEHNVTQGDVFSIKRQSKSVVETTDGPMYKNEVSVWNRLGDDGDFVMPEEALGQIMVFKVYQKTSMALILTTSKPARLNDVVTAP